MFITSFFRFNIIEWVFYIFLKDTKRARNATSLTHATGAIALNAIHTLYPNAISFDTCASWSTGYFFYDTSFILLHEKINKINMLYIYHHLATSYLISFPPNLYYGGQFLLWAELSNIPSYFVYHYLHLPLKQKLHWWLKIQKIVYGGIRLPVLTWLTYKVWRDAPNKIPVLLAMPVYFMGLAWTATLLKK